MSSYVAQLGWIPILIWLNGCFRHREDDADLNVVEDLSKFMEEFTDIFRPIKMTTLQLQNKQMLLGDFYKLWL